ncbi:SDR family NAD(P)-dependent oxidoreductase [Arcanobacterium ihumii]|uniref:SDR family NAD(P)-dependent oxidoreductase n=1 Tax=Arcanobacterium ihumii TaxID=2138162 RepID=UPI000F52F9C0|nr:SDR family NAD(P)-dependent oxidoreductase [Arcanobacterium ihumii]
MGRALITGASSGLGREFAWALAAEGNDLVLVARDSDRLNKLADELRQKANVGVEVLPADLNSVDGVDSVAKRIQAVNQPVTLLINNAGMGLGQDFVGGDITRELNAINVMVNAVLVLTHAAVNTMVPRGRGTIINVSSITSMTVQGTYSAHKAWVKVFTEGVATDLEGTGVNITAVLPGLMHTEFHQRVKVDAGQWQEFMFMDPQYVANVALDAARRGQVIVVPTAMYKATYGLLKFAPRTLVRRFAGPKMSGRL